MSHITTTKTDVKFEDEDCLKSALEMAKNQFVGLTYEYSGDRKIIAVHYNRIDDPVKSYHPEGNMRFSQKNDGTWELSGDTYRCKDEYNAVVDAVQVGYLQAGVQAWSDLNHYSTDETTENKQRVVIARKW